MKKKIRAIFSVTLLFCMVLGINVSATSVRETVAVSINQMWTPRPEISRTRNYSYVTAKTYAVYPTDNTRDNFEKIQVVVRNGNVTISDIYVLNETEGSETIYLQEGYLAASEVIFAFRGNDPNHAAYADVYYDAK